MADIEILRVSGNPLTIQTVLTAVVAVVLAFLISAILQRAVAKAFGTGDVERRGSVKVIRRLCHYLVLFVGVAIALEILGMDLSTVLAGLAVFGVVVALTMQEISRNFVAGIILLLERTIQPGDVLEVENRLVRLEELGFRSSRARTLDEEEIIIPNYSLVQSMVVNYTLKDSFYRLRARVGVSYACDMDLVISVLEAAADGVPSRSQHQEPLVLMSELADSSVVFTISVWIDDPWKMRRIRSQLNYAIWRDLRQNDITIAFPQLDVHTDAPLPPAPETG